MRLIKKYANRRLYDTQESRYITQDDIKQLVIDEVEFKVVSAKAGEDLTNQVLTQVLIEQENPILTSFILRQLIRFYHRDKDGYYLKFLEKSLEWFSQQMNPYGGAIPSMNSPDVFQLLMEQNRKNWDSWQKMIQSFVDDPEKSST